MYNLEKYNSIFEGRYFKKLLFKIAMIFVIIGALNWLLIGIFDFNLVSYLFGKSMIENLIYIIVGLSAIGIMFDRDTYLPFLGQTIAPCSVLENREPPGATKEIKIVISPNSKVLYWAAEPANENLKNINSWKEAYLKYENAGVATSNGEGVAVLKVREPQSYSVPFKGKLNPHVHYRVCDNSGFMSRVNTVFINKSEPEGFEDKIDKNYKVKNLADSSASIY